jgi:hypothetical protein
VAVPVEAGAVEDFTAAGQVAFMPLLPEAAVFVALRRVDFVVLRPEVLTEPGPLRTTITAITILDTITVITMATAVWLSALAVGDGVGVIHIGVIPMDTTIRLMAIIPMPLHRTTIPVGSRSMMVALSAVMTVSNRVSPVRI